MDLSNLGQLGIAGLIAAATALVAGVWPYLRGLITTLRTQLVVRVTIDHWCAQAVLYHLYAKDVQKGVPKAGYDSVTKYIRPLRLRRRVAIRSIVETALLMWRGRPLYLVAATSKDRHEITYKLMYARGTIDVEALLEEALEAHSQKRIDRYQVVRLSGKETLQGDASRRSWEDPDDVTRANVRTAYCGWKEEDIGEPLARDTFANLALSSALEGVRHEANAWLKSREDYESRGVPWRYSIMLHGTPGQGKTSFVRALAQEMNVPVYILDIATMSNQELSKHWSTCAADAPCIVLTEDIDRAFDENKMLRRPSEHKVLTLDCLLNCLAGVEDASGVLAIFTANFLDNIDPALLRPGRMDTKVEVTGLTPEGMRHIAQRILRGYPEAIEEVCNAAGLEESGAIFERRCQARMVAIFKEQHKKQKEPVYDPLD